MSTASVDELWRWISDAPESTRLQPIISNECSSEGPPCRCSLDVIQYRYQLIYVGRCEGPSGPRARPLGEGDEMSGDGGLNQKLAIGHLLSAASPELGRLEKVTPFSVPRRTCRLDVDGATQSIRPRTGKYGGLELRRRLEAGLYHLGHRRTVNGLKRITVAKGPHREPIT